MNPPPPIHVIDFEGHLSYGVVEYGVATIFDGKIVSARTQVCRPVGSIPAEDTRLHRLTMSHLERSEPFSSEWAHFVELRKSGPFAAHNASYEHNLLKNLWAYPPVVPCFAESAQPLRPEWGPWLDSCQLARLLWPTLGNYKLSALVDALHLQSVLDAMAEILCPKHRRHFHAALYDAMAAALILLKIMDSLKADGLPASARDLYALLLPDPAQKEWDF